MFCLPIFAWFWFERSASEIGANFVTQMFFVIYAKLLIDKFAY